MAVFSQNDRSCVLGYCQERPCHIGQIHRATKVSGGVCTFENHSVFLHIVDKKKNVQKSFHRYRTD